MQLAARLEEAFGIRCGHKEDHLTLCSLSSFDLQQNASTHLTDTLQLSPRQRNSEFLSLALTPRELSGGRRRATDRSSASLGSASM